MDTNFCSRCGFSLIGTADLIRLGGVMPGSSADAVHEPSSPRSRGIKQGLFTFLLSFLIVPLLIVFSITVNLRSPALAVTALILLVSGAILRMAFAWLFESPIPDLRSRENSLNPSTRNFSKQALDLQLQPQREQPVSDYKSPAAGRWRDTNDLEIRSVTEGTTRLLGYEEPS